MLKVPHPRKGLSQRLIEAAPLSQRLDVARRPHIDGGHEHQLPSLEDERIIASGENAAQEPVE